MSKPAAGRLASLDALRGATIAGMILVNNSGDEKHTWWPLLHQPWHGWTPTDLIFPFFVFMVGMSLTFSHRLEPRSALARSLKLIALGLVVNFTTGGFTLPLRWAGVLQRIGVCYLAAWAAKRWLRPRGQAVLAAFLLVGYWGAMKYVVGPEGYPPNLEPRTNLSAQVDRIVLSGHLYRWSKYWDPEGVLSTFPALSTALLGLLAGGLLRSSVEPRKKVFAFLAGGLAAFVLGILWGEAAPPWLVFPINKNLWSPSFVLLTAGLGAVLFGLAFWLADVERVRGWTRPLVTYGANPIAVYVGSEILSGVLGSVRWAAPDGLEASLQQRIHALAFASWLPPMLAALAYALANVVLWWAVARGMERRGVYLKV